MGLNRALEATPFPARRRIDEEKQALVGSRCADCTARSWPSRAICARCGSDRLAETALPTTGPLTSFTTVRVPRAGLPTPYVLGQIDLGAGAMVFAHIRELPPDATVPVTVRLTLNPEPAGEPRFWFEPQIVSDKEED
ncbi:Zn-ribbon domain-containing OB-fold protein [Actinomadura sp. 9N215]|uniref:Zn-ribbon domain-containing OB-fold protein n=1 Tax=Actinomadura sp. 9N215 TaxID=3375150 RepID=UPI0037A88030